MQSSIQPPRAIHRTRAYAALSAEPTISLKLPKAERLAAIMCDPAVHIDSEGTLAAVLCIRTIIHVISSQLPELHVGYIVPVAATQAAIIASSAVVVPYDEAGTVVGFELKVVIAFCEDVDVTCETCSKEFVELLLATALIPDIADVIQFPSTAFHFKRTAGREVKLIHLLDQIWHPVLKDAK